jgi:hypothetical protein
MTRPFLQALAAMERVLNMRAAHNHLSIRATSMLKVKKTFKSKKVKE